MRPPSSLSMHRRTLNRQLMAQGMTFQAVLDEVPLCDRVPTARLHGSPLREIAASLGYAETSAFSRAFRRWSGTAPSRAGAQALDRPFGSESNRRVRFFRDDVPIQWRVTLGSLPCPYRARNPSARPIPLVVVAASSIVFIATLFPQLAKRLIRLCKLPPEENRVRIRAGPCGRSRPHPEVPHQPELPGHHHGRRPAELQVTSHRPSWRCGRRRHVNPAIDQCHSYSRSSFEIEAELKKIVARPEARSRPCTNSSVRNRPRALLKPPPFAS